MVLQLSGNETIPILAETWVVLHLPTEAWWIHLSYSQPQSTGVDTSSSTNTGCESTYCSSSIILCSFSGSNSNDLSSFDENLALNPLGNNIFPSLLHRFSEFCVQLLLGIGKFLDGSKICLLEVSC